MSKNEELSDRWALLNYFNGDFPVAPAVKGSVNQVLSDEVRRKATAQIWKFAAENRRRGRIPLASPNTFLVKKRLRRQ